MLFRRSSATPRQPDPRPPRSCRFSGAAFALALLPACASHFELDLPPEHPSHAAAPPGAAVVVPDPAGIEPPLLPPAGDGHAMDTHKAHEKGMHDGGTRDEGAPDRDDAR